MAYREYESQRNRNRDRDGDNRIRFDLIEQIGVLSTKENGWQREANIVSWNGGVEKLDIREWDPRHERMTKGITLFADEAEALAKALADRYGLSAKSSFPPRPAQQSAAAVSEEDIPFDCSPEPAPHEQETQGQAVSENSPFTGDDVCTGSEDSGMFA